MRHDGSPTYKPGCGSTNIRRKENEPGGGRSSASGVNEDPWADFVRGKPAFVSGTQLRPEIDWSMGPRDEEAEVRHEDRLLAINGNHSSFVAADNLDGKRVAKNSEVSELLRESAALVTHLINAASMAWGVWHFEKTGNFEDYRSRVADLKQGCLNALPDKVRRKVKSLREEPQPA